MSTELFCSKLAVLGKGLANQDPSFCWLYVLLDTLVFNNGHFHGRGETMDTQRLCVLGIVI